MKKLFPFVLAALFTLFACSKDDKVKQLPFGLAEVSSLINKSEDHISKASPGELNTYSKDSSLVLYEFVYEGISDFGKFYMDYFIENNRCQDILMGVSVQTTDNAFLLVEMADADFGTAEEYDLTVGEDDYSFSSYSNLLQFLSMNSIDDADVDEIDAYYLHGNNLIVVGGFGINGIFIPLASVEQYGGEKKSTARIHLRDLAKDHMMH